MQYPSPAEYHRLCNMCSVVILIRGAAVFIDIVLDPRVSGHPEFRLCAVLVVRPARIDRTARAGHIVVNHAAGHVAAVEVHFAAVDFDSAGLRHQTVISSGDLAGHTFARVVDFKQCTGVGIFANRYDIAEIR